MTITRRCKLPGFWVVLLASLAKKRRLRVLRHNEGGSCHSQVDEKRQLRVRAVSMFWEGPWGIDPQMPLSSFAKNPDPALNLWRDTLKGSNTSPQWEMPSSQQR